LLLRRAGRDTIATPPPSEKGFAAGVSECGQKYFTGAGEGSQGKAGGEDWTSQAREKNEIRKTGKLTGERQSKRRAQAGSLCYATRERRGTDTQVCPYGNGRKSECEDDLGAGQAESLSYEDAAESRKGKSEIRRTKIEKRAQPRILGATPLRPEEKKPKRDPSLRSG
jgi:hypothetical protein